MKRRWALTPHAAERTIERKISIDDLESVINSPEETISQGPKLILTKTLKQRSDNKIAAVVLEKKGEDLWLVLTVMVNFQKNR